VIEPPLGSGPVTIGLNVLSQSNGDLAFEAIARDSGNLDVAVLRVDASGRLDSSFGSGGIAYLPNLIGPTPVEGGFTASPDGGYALASTVGSGQPTAVVARLTADGGLDASFGVNGVAEAPIPRLTTSFGGGLIAQADGKLVLSGFGVSGGSGPISAGPFVARLNADGTLDASFGDGGLSFNPVPGATTAGSMSAAVTPDGNLVLSGQTSFLSTGAFLQEIHLDTAPTVLFIYAPQAAQTGTPVQFAALAAANDGNSITGYSWDFGTGNFGAATGSPATHTFTAPGTYTVRVRATDSYGLSTVSTQTVSVTAAPATTTGTIPTATVSTTPPVTPAIATGRLRLVSLKASHGRIKIRLACTGASCLATGGLTTLEHLISGRTASLSSGGHGKHTRTVRVASLNLKLQAGRTRTFTIKLNRTGRRLLAAFRRIPARARIRLISAADVQTVNRRITLR
jgi:uncharacterized delta-60 repeat protein